MATDDPNQDVIAAARGMRAGYPFMAPPADDDPNAAAQAAAAVAQAAT